MNSEALLWSSEVRLERIKLFLSNLISPENENAGRRKCPVPSKVKVTISGIRSKISRHTKRQEDRTHNKEEKQGLKADPEVTQMVELADKDVKPIIFTVFHVFQKVP